MPMNFDNLNNSVKELIRKNPDNPITRSVLRKIGYVIPSNIVGSESLIEYLNSLSPIKISKVSTPYTSPTNNGIRNREETLSVEISASEREHGSCYYSVRRSGYDTVDVPISIIRDSILEDDYDLITDYIRDNLEISFDDYDNYDYSEHECNDADDYSDDNDDNKASELWDSYIRRYGDPRTEDEDENENENE